MWGLQLRWWEYAMGLCTPSRQGLDLQACKAVNNSGQLVFWQAAACLQEKHLQRTADRACKGRDAAESCSLLRMRGEAHQLLFAAGGAFQMVAAHAQ